MTDTRLTLRQAAAVLDVSESAIRKRVERGTLRSDKGPDGKRYVYLDTVADNMADERADTSATPERDVLISELRAHNDTLREQLEAERQAHAEARRLLMRALERIPPAIEAPSEARESPETVEEEPERAEPRPDRVETQEGTDRLQQRSGWLAPVDKLPWWQYLLGLGLISLEVPILGLAFAFPASFGFWVGLKRRNLSLWRNLVPMGLIVGAIEPGMFFAVPGLWAQSFLFLGKLSLVDVLFVMFVLFIPALSFISGAIIGRALQRRTAGAYASLTPDIEDSSSAPRPTTPGDGWSPRKQAILGFAGTLIAALLSLIATLVSTIMASGG